MENETCRGFSLVEFMVVSILTVFSIGIVTQIIVTSNQSYTQDTQRIWQNDATRSAFNYLVRTLRESGAVVVNDDLDNDSVKEGSILGVNFKLDDPSTGKAAVRDGLLIFTDSDHKTVYFDGDQEGEPGYGFPDTAGFDDQDGDGKSDILGVALIPQTERKTGYFELSLSQEELRAKHFNTWPDTMPIPNYMIDPIPQIDGRSPVCWKLVCVRFDKLADVSDLSKWRKGRTIMENLRPYVSQPKTSTENFDTISYEGFRPESYDYGHDVTFETNDEGELDGIVDEQEVGSASPGSQDNFINTAEEIRLISAIRFDFTNRTYYAGSRMDDHSASTSVSPRAFALVQQHKLNFPVPQT